MLISFKIAVMVYDFAYRFRRGVKWSKVGIRQLQWRHGKSCETAEMLHRRWPGATLPHSTDSGQLASTGSLQGVPTLSSRHT